MSKKEKGLMDMDNSVVIGGMGKGDYIVMEKNFQKQKYK